MAPPDPDSSQAVYTLLVQVGRKPGDGLPDGATGAGILCFTAARDEAEAVRETTAILKQADMAPLDIVSYGTQEERARDGEISEEERGLMAQAAEQNAVIVAELTPFFDEPDEM